MSVCTWTPAHTSSSCPAPWTTTACPPRSGGDLELPEAAGGSLRRRALARRLKELREDAGLSGRALAAELGWSQAKVSRGERGETMLPVEDIQRWLTRCAAPEDETARLLAI